MAKEEKAKFRVFFGEIEGDNQTIREGLKSIASAVNRTFSSDTKTVRLISVGGDGTSKISPEEVQEIIEADSNADDADDDDSSASAADSDSDTNSKPRKPRKAPSYSIVKELNLLPEGREAFSRFFGRKKPSGPQEMVTVCAYWLTKIAELTAVGPNHIYTCLKAAHVSVPPNIAQVCRNTANRKGWLDSKDGNDLKVTTAGENHIEHQMSDHPSE